MNKLIIIIVVLIGGWFLFGENNSQKKPNEITSIVENRVSENIAYIALGEADKIAVIDMDTKQVIKEISTGDNPHGVASTEKYIFTTSTKMGPREMAMVPEGDGEMVDGENMNKNQTNAEHGNSGGMKKVGSNVVTVISKKTGSLVKEINVDGGSHHIAASNDGSKVAVVVPSKNGVSIIDVETLEAVDFFETGKVSNYPVFSMDDSKLIVTNSAGNSLSIINMETGEVSNVDVSALPDHVVLGKNSKFAYTANGATNSVGIIDIEKNVFIKNIATEKVPHGIAISIDGKKLYVANSMSKSVSILDIEKENIVNTIKFDDEIAHIEVTPNGKELWVNSEEAKKTYVVDLNTNKIISEIQINEEPHQISF